MGKLTLGEYIKQIAVRMQDANMMMTLKDDRPWHMLFYRLRQDYKGQPASFLSDLQFDWDGPYPKSQDVSDFLQGLHWTGSISALNPSYERMLVPPEVHSVWKTEGSAISQEDEALLSHGIEIARNEFEPLRAA